MIESKIFGNNKKVFFVGAMGTGKTEIAINFAYKWSRFKGATVGLIDLDMVKPCFRLRSIKDKIENKLVELIIPRSRYGYADFPIIPPEMESYIVSPDRPAVIDVGGDELGARLVGRYHKRLSPEDVDFLYVYNANRPLWTGSDTLEMIQSIQSAGKFNLTGIVHNSHLMGESTIESLKKNIPVVEEIASKANLKIRFHCIREDLFEETTKELKNIPLFPLKLYLTPEWM